ncbi:MAG: hypothetical protein WAT67_05140 [Candidatus Contendobacter sp.]
MANVIDELKKIQQEKASGTLVVLDQKKQMARVSVVDGQIVSVSFGQKSGMDALQMIQQTDITWLQFIKGSNNRPAAHTQLPSTRDILELLGGASAKALTPPRVEKKPAPESLSLETLAVLRETLAEFMGPVAPMICNKILRQAQDLESVLELIAGEIPDRKQAVEFKNRVLQQLP